MDVDPDLVARIAREVAAKLTAETRPPALRVSELWSAWIVVAARRPDWLVVQAHAWYVNEMRFEGPGGDETALGDLRWDECTSDVVDAWRGALERSKDRRFKDQDKAPPIGPATRNRIINSVQSMFTWSAERKPPLVRFNPLAGSHREDESAGEREGWFTEDQFKQFTAHARPLLKKMATVSYRCGGLRNSEVRTLRKRDIDWENGFILIRSSRHKNKRMKQIPTTPDVMELLRAQAVGAPGEFLFWNERDPSGGPVPPGTFAEWVRKARKASGVDLLGEAPVFHHLRHSFGMHMLMKGANPLHVMDVLGVTSPRVARRYMKLAGEAFEVMRDKMTERWTGRKPPVAAPPPPPAAASDEDDE